MLPKNIVVRGSESRTFALTFLRSMSPAQRSRSLTARAEISATGDGGSPQVDDVAMTGECTAN